MNNNEIEDIQSQEVSLQSLRRCAIEHFQPKGARVTEIQTEHVPGVFVLWFELISPTAFDSFNIILPNDGDGKQKSYRVSTEKRRANLFEVSCDTTTTDRRGYDKVARDPVKRNLPYKRALAALGLE